MIKKNIVKSLLIFISIAGLYSCHELSKSIQDTFKGDSDKITENKDASLSEENTENKKSIDFMDNKEALQEAEDLLRAKPELKGKEIKIYQTIHFYADYRISLKIQNPDNSNYVDSYFYENGVWEDPKPVVLSKSDDIAGNIVDLNRIPFVNANNVYKSLVSKLNEIGSKSTDRTVYASTYRNKVTWYPRSISNDRSRYSIEFNEDGTLQSFEQD